MTRQVGRAPRVVALARLSPSPFVPIGADSFECGTVVSRNPAAAERAANPDLDRDSFETACDGAQGTRTLWVALLGVAGLAGIVLTRRQ